MEVVEIESKGPNETSGRCGRNDSTRVAERKHLSSKRRSSCRARFGEYLQGQPSDVLLGRVEVARFGVDERDRTSSCDSAYRPEPSFTVPFCSTGQCRPDPARCVRVDYSNRPNRLVLDEIHAVLVWVGASPSGTDLEGVDDI